ncbi:methylated-DNA--[protein]-cysteine S-methyltransferase [Corynebacterium glyciniphilum]|uniref:methylated-DNA--[protein]-cysteine S-methyltransferase n=1 Tax=Corynebacterium glyciniphilum TaxID=1404244 RepID=UPI003F7B198C
MTTRHTQMLTPLGELTVVAHADAVTGLYFPGHSSLPADTLFGERVEVVEDGLMNMTAIQLTEYFEGARKSFDVPITTHGNDFSEKVWALLRQIPYGGTTTYGALAASLGNPRLAQRVGQVVGQNPVSIIIPCHRVVGADGSLTGYAGGLERKRRLLELEEPVEISSSRLF